MGNNPFSSWKHSGHRSNEDQRVFLPLETERRTTPLTAENSCSSIAVSFLKVNFPKQRSAEGVPPVRTFRDTDAATFLPVTSFATGIGGRVEVARPSENAVAGRRCVVVHVIPGSFVARLSAKVLTTPMGRIFAARQRAKCLVYTCHHQPLCTS